MISYSKPATYTTSATALLWGLAGAYGCMLLAFLNDYILWNSVNFICGMLALPLTITAHSGGQTSYRFYMPAILLALPCIILPHKSILLAAITVGAICVLEQTCRKLPLLALLTLGLMTPVAQHLASLLGFPIRLWLTNIAGYLLTYTGISTATTGNLITFGANEYSVDPACMGINMLLTSLLCGIMIMAVLQKKHHKKLTAKYVFAILAVVFLLNLFSNVMRILALVIFDIGAHKIMHEVTGLVCLTIYVLLPAYWLINKTIAYNPYLHDTTTTSTPPNTKLILAFHLVIIATLCFARLRHIETEASIPLLRPVSVAGYTATMYDKEICKYNNAQTLVYIKKPKSLLSPEHNPVMCWLGTGYTFANIKETHTPKGTIFTGVLLKGKDKLYTAWWYDNGLERTTNNMDWRWKVLKGSPQFAIINVTTSTPEALLHRVNEIMSNNTFRKAL
jgi:exosortase N